MNEYLQPVEESAREDFYQIMLLKYKRKVLEKEKLIEKEEEREIEKIVNLKNQRTLKNKKGIFATKERISNAYTAWVNKSSLPKNNLAYKLRDENRYELDGGVAAVGKHPYRSPGEFYSPAKPKGIKQKIKKIRSDVEKLESPFLNMVGEDQPDELKAIGDDQISRLAGMNDYVGPGEENQTQLDLDKTRKEVRKKIEKGLEKYKESKKGAEAAKVAKTGVEAAKVAKTGAEAAKATKLAKTLKTVKTVFNVTKVATLGAAAETIFISLIVTIIIWWVQIIGAHLIKSKYIPRMSKLDWIGFGFLVGPGTIVQAIPIIILIVFMYVDAYVFSLVIAFLKTFVMGSSSFVIEILNHVIGS